MNNATTLLGILLALCSASLVHAQAPPGGWIEDWQVPAGCSTQAFHEARLQQLISEKKPHRARVSVTIKPSKDGYIIEAEQVIDDVPSGKRVLESAVPNCGYLDDALTLMLARMIDPTGAAQQATEIQSLPKATDADRQQESTRIQQTQDPPQAGRAAAQVERNNASEEAHHNTSQTNPVRLGALAGVGVAYGHAPTLYPRLLLGASLHFDALALDVRLGSALPVSGNLNAASGTSVSYWVSDAALSASLLLPVDDYLTLGIGAAFGITLIEASGDGFTREQSTTEISPFGALLASVFVRLMGGLWLGVEGELRVPWVRDRFLVLTDADVLAEAHRTTVIVPAATLLVRIMF